MQQCKKQLPAGPKRRRQLFLWLLGIQQLFDRLMRRALPMRGRRCAYHLFVIRSELADAREQDEALLERHVLFGSKPFVVPFIRSYCVIIATASLAQSEMEALSG